MWPFRKKIVEKSIEEKSVSLPDTTAQWMVGQPFFKDWSTETAIREGYKVSSWVFACITKIMDSASSVPFVVQQKINDETWENRPDHPLQMLLDAPNPWMDWQTMFELGTAHLYLGGNNLLTKVRATPNGPVLELGILPPDKVEAIAGSKELVRMYKFQRGGSLGAINILPEDMIHIKFPDPSNFVWGISPLQAGSRIVDTDVQAVNWNKVSLQNMNVPTGLISFKDKLSNDQWQAARTELQERNESNDDHRQIMIMGADATFKEMSRNAVEMDFNQGRKMTREEICAIFQVPPVVVGIYENSSLNNVREAREIFWVDTMIPYLTGYVGALNFSLTPEFGDDLRIALNLSQVQALAAIFSRKVDDAKKIWDMGVPFNVINQEMNLGYPEIEGGNTGWVAANLNPAAVASGESIE